MVNKIKNGFKKSFAVATLALAGCSKNASNLGMNKDHKNVRPGAEEIRFLLYDSDATPSLEKLQSLLKCKDLCIDDKVTALYKLAATYGSHEVESLLKQLKQEGINVNLHDLHGRTALHLAATSSLQGVECLLKQEGINVNLQNDDGKTALQAAICNKVNNKLEIIKCLLNNEDINGNLQDQKGNTALHYAVDHDNVNENERLKIVECLLSKENISFNIPNKDGHKATWLAEAKNRTEIVNLILKCAYDRSPPWSVQQIDV